MKKIVFKFLLQDRQLEVKSLEKQVKDLGKLILKLNKQRFVNYVPTFEFEIDIH